MSSLVVGFGFAGGESESDERQFKVGITIELANPVWAELTEEAVRYGEQELGLDMVYVDSVASAATQVSQIENFIQGGMDAIIVTAVEANALRGALQKARDAGVFVVGYTQVIEPADALYLVDAYNTGYACGRRAAQWIHEVYPDTEVKWALMDLPIFPEIIDRANGIKEAIAELAPQATLVATASAQTAEDGYRNAENFLQAHPDLKVIATIGGGGAVGGNEGVKAAGVTDFDRFGLFGIDATRNEIRNILNGDPQKASVSLGGGATHG
ncbi:MAG: sugar ABC transporter substrate-binding protein, partial [Spirochaetales bacterium]|nr:sugar ABC transporter substrate-binding protein [Spirochaetales bacterium]